MSDLINQLTMDASFTSFLHIETPAFVDFLTGIATVEERPDCHLLHSVPFQHLVLKKSHYLTKKKQSNKKENKQSIAHDCV